MAEKEVFQPLTLWDKVSVILYRAGILISSLLLFAGGVILVFSFDKSSWLTLEIKNERAFLFFLLCLYLSVGISVATIHLYAKRFRRLIRFLYLTSVFAFLVILFLSAGLPGHFIMKNPLGALLLMPLAGTLGFIAMKEAFCFRLFEGYLLAILLPFFVFILFVKVLSPSLTGAFLVFIGLMMCYFCWRKFKIPLAYDIGDKSAYEV
jgi:uncharacterized integral membrane protein